MRKYNKYENEIIGSKKISLKRLDFLLKNGADVNAQEDTDIEDGHILDSLFQSVIYNYDEKSKNNLLKILKCFIDNGLDLEKYGSAIISDFHFIYDKNQDIYGMTKLILNSLKKKINLDDAKHGIATESSWLICTYPEDINYNPDYYANYLDGVIKILEKYENGEEYNDIYPSDNAIGEKFNKIYIKGNITNMTDNKIEYNSVRGRNTQLWTTIEFENSKLVVEDNYWAYIENTNNNLETNIFTENINNYLNKERLIKIIFDHYNNNGCGRLCKLIFTNNKNLIYGTRGNKEFVEIG